MSKKLHRCATPRCFELVAGESNFCRACLKQMLIKRRKTRESKRIRQALMSLRSSPGPQSEHVLTADLQLMRKLGFYSYGQLSTWRQQRGNSIESTNCVR